MCEVCRYGDTYATNLLGWPTIVTSSPEVARFVLGAGRKNFKPGYLRTTEEAIDPKRSLHGPLHSRIRRTIQPALRSEAIQAHIPFIDARACVILASWMPGGAVDTYQEMKKVGPMKNNISCPLHENQSVEFCRLSPLSLTPTHTQTHVHTQTLMFPSFCLLTFANLLYAYSLLRV